MYYLCFQGLTACDADGVKGTTSLPKYIKPLGPYNSDATIIQSLATALHVSSQPITGIYFKIKIYDKINIQLG